MKHFKIVKDAPGTVDSLTQVERRIIRQMLDENHDVGHTKRKHIKIEDRAGRVLTLLIDGRWRVMIELE